MRIISIIFILTIFSNKSYGQSNNSVYEIFALKYATSIPKDHISYVALNAPDSIFFEPVFMFWLIKEIKGKNILVDTGFVNDEKSFEKRYNLKSYIRPDLLLKRIGISASDITDIIITHPHRDHIDGINLFPNAQIWMQKEDFNYFVGDAWKKDSLDHGYMRRDVLKIMNANFAQRLNLINGEREIFPGISVYTGSRHTYNSQYVVVENSEQKFVLASDNATTYYNIENNVSAPTYATLDTLGYVRQIKRMKRFVADDKYIIPGHDGLVFSKFKTVAVNIVKIE